MNKKCLLLKSLITVNNAALVGQKELSLIRLRDKTNIKNQSTATSISSKTQFLKKKLYDNKNQKIKAKVSNKTSFKQTNLVRKNQARNLLGKHGSSL